MSGIGLPVLGLFALGYSGLILFALASALRRMLPPRRAAWTAFGVSAVVHSATLLLPDSERVLPLLLFWLLPHLLLLPLLLWAARKQEGGG